MIERDEADQKGTKVMVHTPTNGPLTENINPTYEYTLVKVV